MSIMKHLKHCETSWNTLKTLWTSRNSQTLAIWCDDIGIRCRDIGTHHGGIGAAISELVQSFRRYRRVVSDDIDDCGVGITLQMCNRVTNHGDMGTFSKPGSIQILIIFPIWPHSSKQINWSNQFKLNSEIGCCYCVAAMSPLSHCGCEIIWELHYLLDSCWMFTMLHALNSLLIELEIQI